MVSLVLSLSLSDAPFLSLPPFLDICRTNLCALEPSSAKGDQASDLAASGLLTNEDVVRQLQWQMDMDALDSVIRDSDIKNR